jgi:hypothetical protein
VDQGRGARDAGWRRHECGAVFGWLRLRSGSVLAPLIAHAALNDSALVAGHAAHRLSRPGGRAAGLG